MSNLREPVGPSDHIQGSPDAKVVLVEYGDYQCPICGEAFPVVKQLQHKFGQYLALVFRNFPLVDMHPEAQNAATVAEFAAKHKKFWQAHDALYENQDQLGNTFYAELVNSLGLSLHELQADVNADAFETRIRHDINTGIRSGVNGTPTFFINGQRFDVRSSFEELFEPIDALIHGS